MTLQQALILYLNSHRAVTTGRWTQDRRTALQAFAAFVGEQTPVESVGLSYILEWRETLDLSEGSWQSGRLSPLRAFFGWLKRQGIIQASPTDELPRAKKYEPPVYQPVPDETVRLLIGWEPAELWQIRAKALAMLLLCGLGLKACHLLYVEDVDLDLGVVRSVQAGGVKLLFPTAVLALRRWLEVRPQRGSQPKVFVYVEGKAAGEPVAYYHLADDLRELGRLLNVRLIPAELKAVARNQHAEWMDS